MNMTNQPLVTINVPAFNAQATIKETLESLLNQTYENIEIHVIDNNSNDKTREIIETYLGPKLKLIRNDTNIGAGSFEKCMRLGSGKYTAIYHADDVYDKDIIAKSVNLFEGNEQLGLVMTRAQFIDGDSKITGESKKISSLRKNHRADLILNFQELFTLILKNHNFLICPSAMVRSSIYKNKISRWREDLFKSSADLDVWFSISTLSKLAIINETLIKYRRSQHHFSHLYNLKRTEEADFFKAIDYWLKKDVVKSFISEKDLRNYTLLQFEDSLKCCLHAALLNDNELASSLMNKLKNLYSADYLIRSRKSLAFALGYFILRAYELPLTKKILLPLLKKMNSVLIH